MYNDLLILDKFYRKQKIMSKKNLVDESPHLDDNNDDDDDDDFCPTKTHNEQSDLDDESEHSDDDDDNDALNNRTGKAEDEKQNDLNIIPYNESKTDELWKNFTSSTNSSSTKIHSSETTRDIEKSKIESTKLPLPPITTNKVLEYAGEKIAVPITTMISTANTPLKRPSSSSTSSNSILDRLGIGKKQKLSTLEKSRLDWNIHKESESLTDDLESHRRGKDSYIEKKAFLERSELREHDHYLMNVKKK